MKAFLSDFWPFQRCKQCGRLFWAGLPFLWIIPKLDERGNKSLWLGWQWLPSWNDYCRRECSEADEFPMKQADPFEDECPASGQGCSFGEFGPKGEIQCQFCGRVGQ